MKVRRHDVILGRVSLGRREGCIAAYMILGFSYVGRHFSMGRAGLCLRSRSLVVCFVIIVFISEVEDINHHEQALLSVN